jgi:hypothetical protein
MEANDPIIPAQLLGALGRVRRAMPRNQDVMLICDVAERTIPKQPEPYEKPKFDRKAYQRELMRKRRKEGKA